MNQLQTIIDKAIAHHQANELDEAALGYLQALQQNQQLPAVVQLLGQIVQFHFRVATIFMNIGRNQEAVTGFQRVIAIQPKLPQAHANLGNLFIALGDNKKANQHLRKYLELDPEDAVGARMKLAHTGAEAIPEKPNVSYIKGFYCQYAPNYDQSLLQDLNYQCPQLISQVLQKQGRSDLAILDLGCGTGLCGKAIKPFAKSMDGVDLSGQMLQKAALLGIYDSLVETDALEYLESKVNSYDSIVAAGVFEHIGDPTPLFICVKAALKAGGRFVFTAENNHSTALGVNASGFYTHCEAILRSAAETAGLTVIDFEEVFMWKERQTDVEGLLVTLGAA